VAIISRFPDVEIPDRTLPQFVLDSAMARGDQAAIIDGVGGRTLPYADLYEGVRWVGAGGLRHGCAPVTSCASTPTAGSSSSTGSRQ
jgi:hypothetical protein